MQRSTRSRAVAAVTVATTPSESPRGSKVKPIDRISKVSNPGKASSQKGRRSVTKNEDVIPDANSQSPGSPTVPEKEFQTPSNTQTNKYDSEDANIISVDPSANYSETQLNMTVEDYLKSEYEKRAELLRTHSNGIMEQLQRDLDDHKKKLLSD